MSLNPHELSDTELEQLLENSEVPVLVDLWAPWCVPCRTMSPVIDSLASKAKASGTLLVAKVDIEKYPALMERYHVRGIPTLLLFNGKNVPDRQVGAKTLGQINNWLTEQQISLDTQPTVARTNALNWGSFYGDSQLLHFIAQRTMNHASAGELTPSLDSDWMDNKGSTSTSMVHQSNSQIFERITGLPIAIGKLIDLCCYVSFEQTRELFDSFAAGKDYGLVPLRFISWFLSNELSSWTDSLRDPQLAQALEKWQALCAAVLGGKDISSESWRNIASEAENLLSSYQDPMDQLEPIIAVLLASVSPLPALTDEEKWKDIVLNLHRGLYQHIQIQSGWTELERATPTIRLNWFKEKAQQSPSGELSEEEITQLRDEWISANADFYAKENLLQSNIETHFDFNNSQMQKVFNRLLASSPDF